MNTFKRPVKHLGAVTFLFAVIDLMAPQISHGQDDYDPMQITHQVDLENDHFTYDDRQVPLKVYVPQTRDPSPILLISHGLGGTRDSCTYLGQHWAGRGYAVIAMQHAGSDEAVMKNVPRRQRFRALKDAASPSSATARHNDVAATIDFLERENQSDGKYAGRLDLSKIGMSGHSFGAVTTQAVSGQNFAFLGQAKTDRRIDAACALSPSPPQVGSSDDAFGKVVIPWLLMTGTKDESPIGRIADAAARREVFKALPPSGHFYELVLHDAKHSAFADSKRRRSQRNPNHHKAIQAISTAFWDAYLKQDPSALKWLHHSSVKNVLEPNDQWLNK